MSELVSVIVPIYKVEAFLDRCVQSILNQTYSNLEVILVDDGSPDNCGRMCDEYALKDSRVRVIHKENGGLSDARNAGIAKATGAYITFIDSDDYVEADYVQVLYDTLKRGKAMMAISSHRVLYDGGMVLSKGTDENTVLDPATVLDRMLYHEDIDLSAWGKLYARQLWENVRFPKGRLFEDAATTYKLMDKCSRIAVDSKETYNYIIRQNSISNNEFSPKKMDLIVSTGEMCRYVRSKYPKLAPAADRRLMYAYLSTLSQLAMSKKRFPKEQKELMSYIKKNGKTVLKDKRAPKRDKMGIIMTKFGFGFYKIAWKMYVKLTGRKK